MSRPQRMLALAVVVVAALMCLGMANADWEQSQRDRKQSLYTCTVWNDRSWAGC